MKFLIINILNFFDFFYKKKIKKELIHLSGNHINTLFDVGSHRGETIRFISSFIKVKNIYAFEPLKKNFDVLLQKTNKINKKNKTNIIYYQMGLGEKTESKIIKEMKETSSSTLNDINTKSKYFRKKSLLLNFGSNKNFYKEKEVKIIKAASVIKKKSINIVDLLKIDTEGYEFSAIKGFDKELHRVKVILFEHHYNLMIKKNYKFSDINNYLKLHDFFLLRKFKMPFRKTFEYIYCNKKFY